jgi:hypothetical protein
VGEIWEKPGKKKERGVAKWVDHPPLKWGFGETGERKSCSTACNGRGNPAVHPAVNEVQDEYFCVYSLSHFHRKSFAAIDGRTHTIAFMQAFAKS